MQSVVSRSFVFKGLDPNLIEHTVELLCAQMIYGLNLGYEDLNDHDRFISVLSPAPEK
jgi:hypothetical protein